MHEQELVQPVWVLPQPPSSRYWNRGCNKATTFSACIPFGKCFWLTILIQLHANMPEISLENGPSAYTTAPIWEIRWWASGFSLADAAMWGVKSIDGRFLLNSAFQVNKYFLHANTPHRYQLMYWLPHFWSRPLLMTWEKQQDSSTISHLTLSLVQPWSLSGECFSKWRITL